MAVRFSSRVVSAALLALTATVSGAAQAQDKPDAVSIRTEPIPEINVVGERPLTKKAISKSVYQLAQSNSVDAPIPRFHDPLCLTVAGLGERLNKDVSGLIEENAREATLPIGKEGCRPNAFVLIVDDPEKLIERIKKRTRRGIGPRANAQIRGAMARGDPVIGWNATRVRGRNGQGGQPLDSVPGAVGQTVFNADPDSPPSFGACVPSRVTLCHSYARVNSFVVFDVRRLENVHINQLADYATMYLIGSPRRLLDHEKLEGTSIMSLFRDGPLEAPIGLTRLDRAYLRGLYTLRPSDKSQRLVGSTRKAYLQIAEADTGPGAEKADGASENADQPRAGES